MYRNQKRASGGAHTPAQVRELLAKQRCLCVYCRASLKRGYDEDHIVPVSRGGSNDITNIQLLCPTCNRRKNATDPIVFAQRNGFLL